MRITKGPPLRPGRKGAAAPNRDEAEALGLRALTFLVEEEPRIQRFLQLTGVDPGALPAWRRARAFCSPCWIISPATKNYCCPSRKTSR